MQLRVDLLTNRCIKVDGQLWKKEQQFDSGLQGQSGIYTGW